MLRGRMAEVQISAVRWIARLEGAECGEPAARSARRQIAGLSDQDLEA